MNLCAARRLDMNFFAIANALERIFFVGAVSLQTRRRRLR